MGRLFIGRLFSSLGVLLGITMISFILANISPVDPAEAYARREFKGADEARISEIRKELGFDKSMPEQYVHWLKRAVRLDFGTSYITRRPVMDDMINAMPVTLLIAALAALLILVLSIPLGILSAAKEGSPADSIAGVLAFFSLSIPGYFLGLLFLWLFGFKLKLFPVVGHGDPMSILFASLVLALPMAGSLTKLLRALILEYRKSDFAAYAMARGISKNGILWRHLLRNAAPPCVTMFGQNIGYLIAGTAVVETIFSCTGMGAYALNAAMNRDFPAVTAYALVMAAFFVLCNLGADLLGLLLDPRSRQSRERAL